MFPLFWGYGLILATAIIVIVADILLKLAADSGQAVHHHHVLTGCALYVVSALVWFAAMQTVGIAQAGIAYAMFTLIALCAIGVWWFEEPFGLREGCGLGCALMAMVLMVRFH
jgi:small multidrug resistance pump